MTITFRNALDVGSRVDRYEVEAVIGHGGFGISYRAMDTESGERVAIKEFLPTDLATREADDSVYPLSESHLDNFQWGLERFLDEARLLARFHHPNIVHVHRAFEGNGTAYMVMECEEGESLAACLKRENTLASEALTAMIMPLLDGLELVHEAGFIHRDIKPSNIYLRRDGTPVLLDFGSARQALKGKTRTLTALVSAGYAPLEQYFSRSDLQGPWTDIYGLGATLYHAIGGEPPIDAVERSRGVLGSTRDILPPVAEIAKGDYPPCLLAAVDHALRMEDQERPRSIGEWRKELTGETPVPEARVTTVAAPETRTATVVAQRSETDAAKPHRNRMGLFSFAAILVIAIGSLGWWQWPRDEPLDDRGIEPASKVTEHRSDEQVATLRGSLAKASLAADSSRKRIEELTAKLAELEAVQESTNNENVAPKLITSDDQIHSENQDVLVAELRMALETANTQSDEARQQVGELAARLRMLEATRQTKNVEASSQRQEIDGLLAAAATDISRLRLTTPVGENAHERYRRVLELEENNADALLGLEQIVEKYIELAERARDDEQFHNARDYLHRASTVLPAYAALATAQDKLAEIQRVRNPRNRAAESKPPDLQSLDEVDLAKLEAGTPEDDANASVTQKTAMAQQATAGANPPGALAEARVHQALDDFRADREPYRIAVMKPAFYYAFGQSGDPNDTGDLGGDIYESIRQQPAFSITHADEPVDPSALGYLNRGGNWPFPPTNVEPNEAWQGSYVHKTPNLERLYRAGQELELDAVVAWFYRPVWGVPQWPVEVYAIDVEKQRVYLRKGLNTEAEALVRQALDDFRAGRDRDRGKETKIGLSETGAPSPASRDNVRNSLRGSVNVAILPFSHRRSTSLAGLDNIISRKLTSGMDKADRCRIVYSYYDPDYNTAPAGKMDRLWTGGPVSYQLDEARAIEIATDLGADVIVTAQKPLTHSGQWGHDFDARDYDVDIFLLDVRRKILHQQTGKIAIADEIVSRLAAQAGITGASSPVDTGKFSVAVLPYDWITTVNFSDLYLAARDVGREILQHLQDRTDAVVFFDYSEGSDSDEIPTKYALWQGSQVKREPKADIVYRIGKKLGVDTVLMWQSKPIYQFDSWPVTIHLYDIDARRTYRLDGTNVKVTEVVDAAVQRYLDSAGDRAAPDSRRASSPTSPTGQGAQADL